MLRQVFDGAPVALILVDTKGHITLLNNEAEGLFGYSREELIGQPIEILIPSSLRKRHPQLVNQFFKTPAARSMGKGQNLFGLRKNGSEFPIEVGLKPIQTTDGTFVMSSIIDITLRLKAEEKFRTAVEAAPNAMIMVDEAAHIVLVNDQTEQLFGYSRQELLGQPIELLVPIEVRGKHPSFVKMFMRSPTPRAMGVGRDLHARKKDGSTFPVEIGLRPFNGPDGLYVISSIVDISERIQARKKLLERNEELEQFAYRTSHDLKAPLISIRGLAEYLVEDISSGEAEEAKKNAEKIISLSSKLHTLIEDILQLTKSDYINEEFTVIDLDGILQTTYQKLEILLAEKNVTISESLAHQKSLFTQKTRLSQILDNLISNAVKYADPKKSSRTVSIRTSTDDDTFSIEVKDNGLGIPLNRQAEVFGMFKRFHSENHMGSGLGLYLVKRHVERLGGQITFTSSDQGTSFVLKLPLFLATAKSN